MSSLFSSPSKQATAAAQASQQISQQDIAQLEQYVTGQQGQLRDAIGSQGPNPYFAAAQQVNPQAYYTDPKNTVTFSNRGPGTSSGNMGAVASQPGPPNFPGVIMPAPTQPPAGVGTGGGGGGTGTGGGGGGTGPGDGNGPIVINPITGRPIGGRQLLNTTGGGGGNPLNPLPIDPTTPITPIDIGSGPIQSPFTPGQGRTIPPRQLM